MITKANKSLINISDYMKIDVENLGEYNKEYRQLQVFLDKLIMKYKSSSQEEPKTRSAVIVDLFTHYE